MDSTREANKGRACLLLSLIVLVCNAAATGRHFLFAEATAESAGPGEAVAASTARTVRQNFLLGRKVDVNRADRREIGELPGISDTVAQAVVEFRARTGRFRGPGDLLRVPGIKEKRLKKILPFLAEFPNN